MEFGLCKTSFLSPSGDWILCYHATLMDVQAAFPSRTPVTGVKGEENGYSFLPTCSVPGSMVYVLSQQLHGVDKWYYPP